MEKYMLRGAAVLCFLLFATTSNALSGVRYWRPWEMGASRLSFDSVECDSYGIAGEFLTEALQGGRNGDRGGAAARFLNSKKHFKEGECSRFVSATRVTPISILQTIHNLDLRDILLHQYTTLTVMVASVEVENDRSVTLIFIDCARTPFAHRPKGKRGRPLKERDE